MAASRAQPATVTVTVTASLRPPDVNEFKRVMRQYPTGAVIVTTSLEGRPHGMAVNSFTSVSLDPLLVMFCANRASTTWSVLRTVGRFAVSVLAAEQADTCRIFATKGVDRFAALPWSYSGSGQPILDEAIAWLDCEIDTVVPAGDHEIVVGRVLAAHHRPDGEPLVYHQGRFTGVRD